MGEDTMSYLPLFETKVARGRLAYKLYFFSVTVGLCLMSIYRVVHFPVQGTRERLVWIGMFMSELWFSLYWFITQSARWKPFRRYTFKDRLSHRYEEVLPKVDIFVCTADHTSEPPLMVVNTVLSVMAYNYPPEKLSVYLSDDGGSELMFYALIEASRFSKYWLPFCNKFNVEPRSPAAYFSTSEGPPEDPAMAQQWQSIKKLYEDMKKRIERTTTLGQIPEHQRKEHKGFREWDSVISKRDHNTILEILIDGRDLTAWDIDDQPMPTLVYLAREKRPHYHHNFKAGALNALLRVSSQISNGLVILTLDCDMYSNDPESIKDALCFFLDEKQGTGIGYIQFPQHFINITRNDIYSSSFKIIAEVEFPGIDGNGGPPYIGTGCFHRRKSISGKKHGHLDGSEENTEKVEERAEVLEQTCRILASCSYEENTQWGEEIGVKYGCPVEDVSTGLMIQYRGWRSVFFNPERKAFLGLAPTTLLQTLVQQKRWAEGDLQIFLSKYCPLIYGRGKIPLQLRISYCVYLLWCPNCLAILYYVSIPSLYMYKGVSLFPKISSNWVLPFGYVTLATYGYSFGEYLWSGGTFRQWWNDQRMWIFKTTTAYLFGFTETVLKLLGMTKEGFQVTAKVSDEEVGVRYEKELMEFGSPSPMFNILATLSLINLFSFLGGLKMMIMDLQARKLDLLALQMLLCGFLVLIYLPIYTAIFLRKDNGRMPISIFFQSAIITLIAHMVARGRLAYKLYFFSVAVGLCLMSIYRVVHFPVQGTRERLVWIGMFMSELWFSLYWFITQSARWKPFRRYTFKDRLSHRYEEVLPKVDIFVCTADHTSEPPLMVVNTVLSVMAYNYPPEKLSVYLSDDGGSELMFYALLEASRFSKYWLPFCNKFNVKPRSPAAYFSTSEGPPEDPAMAQQWQSIKKLYEDMKKRIERTTTLGQIPEHQRKEHKGFREWDSVISRRDHNTILEILIDGRDLTAWDIDEQPMPTLVYLAREKRPHYHHNFKAGALNALLRVSSQISNGLVILTLDCDMYSNDPESIRDALCFFLDEKQGTGIGYIQFPQHFINIKNNDIYSSSFKILAEVEFPGIDGNGGPLYIGTGCFHRRKSISGKKHGHLDGSEENSEKVEERAEVLEQTCRILASCSYEENTQWGEEIGVKYGFPVEDISTGLMIQCRGWRSVYFNPERKAFLGLAPTTLLQTLVQQKRWVEGDFQIFLSKYCPLIYGCGKIPLALRISYCLYLLWCPNCVAILYYVSIPSLYMYKGISLFPKISSNWVLPFGYVTLATYGYSFGEYLWSGGTFRQWWNDQRIWIFKTTTAYFFGFTETVLKLLGMTKEGFQVTAKVSDEEVGVRYEKELMEFGSPSPMFNILATLSLINLFSFLGGLKMMIMDLQARKLDLLALQILLCGFLVLIYLPIYIAIFLRKDNGRMPISIFFQSAIITLAAHTVTMY